MNQAWNAIRAALRKMLPACDARPIAGSDIFKCVEGAENQVKFEIKPVVFKVPERATSRDANLFVAISGWLSFEGPNYRERLKTKAFNTEIGYFRLKDAKLEHVYGAHYDIDETQPGHPVFHAQVSPQMGMLEHVKEQFRKDSEVKEDRVQFLLRNVRTPSAQMDVFSVIAQICADHLMHRDSGVEVRQAFAKMRSECDFFIGAAYRMAYLNANVAPTCYRSTHWYAGDNPIGQQSMSSITA
ncbi:hypothetical protein [Bradyrhizobium sp. USDA 4518]